MYFIQRSIYLYLHIHTESFISPFKFQKKIYTLIFLQFLKTHGVHKPSLGGMTGDNCLFLNWNYTQVILYFNHLDETETLQKKSSL